MCMSWPVVSIAFATEAVDDVLPNVGSFTIKFSSYV